MTEITKNCTRVYINPEYPDREFFDPDFRLLTTAYPGLTSEEAMAYTWANRYRISDQFEAGPVQIAKVAAALNILHKRAFPWASKPVSWTLVENDRNPGFKGRYFKLTTNTGKTFGFSLNKHFTTYHREMQKSFRAAINDQCKEFMAREFTRFVRERNDNPTCPDCGVSIVQNSETTSVDHIFPFQGMLDKWVEIVDGKLDRESGRELVWPANDPKKDYFLDDFVEWHRKWAKLRLVCKPCNVEAGQAYKQERIDQGISWYKA